MKEGPISKLAVMLTPTLSLIKKQYFNLMNRKFIAICLLLTCLFTACSRNTFKQSLNYNHFPTTLTERVDSLIASTMNHYNIPGLSIGIIKDDSVIFSKGYGVTGIINQKKVTEYSIFHTASVSKIFTALAIMHLIENRQLALDEKLVTIIPKLKYTDKRVNDITIKTMLNHTSGIPDINSYNWSNNNQDDSSLKNYILNKNIKLEFAPATKYAYSNLAYDILGLVVEQVSGLTFEEYVKSNILTPNEMIQSDFRYFKIADSLKTYPHSKSWLSKNVYQRNIYPYTREHSPSSTLNSSTIELSKWMISFIKKLDTEKEPYYFQSMIKQSTNLNKYIGLGFQLNTIEGQKTIGHFGGDKGFRSYLLIIPDKKIGAVVLANCDYNEDFRQEIINQILKIMLARVH